MFQYAVARAISINNNIEMCLDVSNFENYSLHNGFELDTIFNLNCHIASKNDIKQVLGWRANTLIKKLLLRSHFAALRGNSFIVEPQVNYWPNIKNIPCDSYLIGYWLSEKYFQNIESLIREDFTFKTELSKENKFSALQIENSNSVSIHIRRGDIAQNPTTLAVHGLCSIDYYKNAIRYITNIVESPSFYIFSDDMEWVKKNLKIDHPCYFIDHNKGKDSYNDMRLMSLCKHNIIANSTFSWWGAWLNVNKNKIVVAPNKWFEAQINSSDIIPETWIRL